MRRAPWFDPYAERPWKGLHWLVLEEAGVTFENGLVFVPYPRQDGSVHNRKVFDASGHSWWEKPGLPLLPFGLETLTGDPRRALINAEGESDALALREAFAAVTAESVIRGYDVLGLPGATSWQPEWRAYVGAYDLVYVVPDGDLAGRRMADRVCADAPWARVVLLPAGEDARSILQRLGPRALDSYFDEADQRALAVETFFVARSLGEWRELLSSDAVTGHAA